MTVFVCIDERGGMTFNKRRQSRDRLLIDDVALHADDGMIFVTDYSEPLFRESAASVVCVTNPLDSAKNGGYAFIENMHLSEYSDAIDELVVYKWNRHYPSDFKLDIKPDSNGRKLAEVVEFAGSSHEKITKEIYRK